MRTKHTLNFALTTGVAGIALLLGMSAAQADVILEIDVFSPTEINFIPTPALAQNTNLSIDSNSGIALVGFYSGNSIAIGDENATVGDINVFNTAAGTTRRELDQFNVGNASGLFPGLSNTDLNFFDDTSGGYDMFFFDDKTALTGTSLVLDPTGVDGPLPTVGMSGDVYAGGLASSNIIGQWQVIPEPGTFLLSLLGLSAVGMIRRRRR